ncbi:helix-turn-helix transcriptional regulator [Solwaraspora sp. WMMD406]|uniref:helix-turn-helix domain-containing protein n=1 Tax=Solwaraspora sp. WMMD406 TaxID=3016095 RepID=UPI002417B166|nr:helix-turn-helix transcriptional regulator [Solwaraspora sp. WMMD406]MDG4764402.1 helix-turn-helix transcriptional regulator [Solwaraspora sp. WMMD406]
MPRSARSFQREADQLRARGLTYRQIARQWKAEYEINSRVAFRLAHGMTQAEVARRWNELWPDADTPKTAKQISYWEIWPGPAGRAPSLDTLNKLAYLYRCSAGELLDGEDYSDLDSLSAINANVHDPSPPAATSSGRISKVTDGVIADLETLTDTYRHLDYREGSGRVSAEVANHLKTMLGVSNRTPTGATHRRLLRAAGDAAQLAGWLAIDAQKYDQAEGYCRLAVSLAEKANDRALHAYGLGVISYIRLHAGDGKGALDVLSVAQSLVPGRSAPAVRSWLSEAVGEAYGFLGQPKTGITALVEAERTFDAVVPDTTPVWLGFYNAECHAARLKGRCLTRLRQPRQATRSLYEALTLLPATFVRERAGTLIDLATAYVQMRQVEQACDVARQADVISRRTGSERNRRRLRELLVDLMPWSDLDCVQSLYRQVLLN